MLTSTNMLWNRGSHSKNSKLIFRLNKFHSRSTRDHNNSSKLNRRNKELNRFKGNLLINRFHKCNNHKHKFNKLSNRDSNIFNNKLSNKFNNSRISYRKLLSLSLRNYKSQFCNHLKLYLFLPPLLLTLPNRYRRKRSLNLLKLK